MQEGLTKIDVDKLQRKLGRVRLACAAAIELGDCQAVAWLLCEASRLRNCIQFADLIRLESV